MGTLIRSGSILLVWLLISESGLAVEVNDEPIGQSSRLTGLVISEIMYHPATRADGKKLEFIELMNTLDTPQDVSGYSLSGDVDYTFPTGTSIPARTYVVVARHPDDLQSVYNITAVLGPFTKDKGLPNDNGTVRLRNRQKAILLQVQYGSKAPWPAAPDGAGPSLVLVRPSYGEGDPRAWGASWVPGGTPGEPNAVFATPLDHILINELLVPAGQQAGFIELYNHSAQAVDLSGCFLSDDPSANKFTIPAGTTIAPGGFISFDLQTVGINLTAAGGTLLLRAESGRVVDAIKFGPVEPGIAFGRSDNGADSFYRLQSATPGAPNAAVRVSDVVLNEIMYHPLSGSDDDQYVELYNRGTTAESLAGWTIAGIKFTFPTNAVLAAGGYAVVARNIDRLRTSYPNLTTANSFGNFSGTLSHGGERIALTMPYPTFSTNKSGVISTNTLDIAVDEVSYQDGGRWPGLADAGGSSLEKIDARADGRLAGNWAASDETSKAGWTTVTATGVLDNGDVAADELQVILQGAGECLIDNVQVLNSNGANLIANSDFEQNANGWTAEGTEGQSNWEASEGFQSAHSYHLRAVERGDNQINRVRTLLTSALSPNTTATISAKVRWIKGSPEILFRLRGKWLEAAGTMNLPAQAGTPGVANSGAIANAGPALYQVQHGPVVPGAGQAVVITARVSDPDGIGSVSVKYRVDPSSTYKSVIMRDDGTGGDQVAQDGIYSATVPGQPSGSTVAFYVSATDSANTTSFFPNDAPARECLIRFGETTPMGDFPVYRIWMTQATLNTWTSRAKLNNSPFDVTFVLGNNRVIYNTHALYAGSPYIAPGYSSPTSGRCGYSVSFPTDDRFLGNTDLVLDWPGGHGGERTAMQEQMAYWLADQVDLPNCNRYTIRLQVNGVTDMQRGGVFEAVNQPAGDFVKAWMPDDSNGDFYKIDRAFEFSDGGGLVSDPEPRLQNYTTTGGAKKTARYRWNWYKRAGSAVNDYSNVFNLVDAANAAAPEPYTSAMENLVDIDEWMGILAMEHIIVNFDAYGHEIGKNMYGYKPQKGKWHLYMFDLDWLMLAAPNYKSSYAASSAPLYNADDPTIVRMYNFAPFRRAYLQTVQRAVDGPMRAEVCNPVMDAKYQALVANGITLCDGQTLTDPGVVKTWFAQRRAYLLTQLADSSASFALTTTGFTTNSDSIQLSGTAPLAVKTIRVNGVDEPITWNTVSGWTVPVTLASGQNVLNVDGYDRAGTLVGSTQITVTNTLAPLTLSAERTAQGTIRISWNTQPGRSYRILYSDDVAAASWTEQDTVVASGSTLTANLPTSAPQRFYRIAIASP